METSTKSMSCACEEPLKKDHFKTKIKRAIFCSSYFDKKKKYKLFYRSLVFDKHIVCSVQECVIQSYKAAGVYYIPLKSCSQKNSQISICPKDAQNCKACTLPTNKLQ